MTPSEGLAQVAEKLPDLLATLPPEEPSVRPSFVHGRPSAGPRLRYSPLRDLLGAVLGALRR